jgi:peptidoglycan/xylan/chitin deacetylase (PgdA/CDA1 family)
MSTVADAPAVKAPDVFLTGESQFRKQCRDWKNWLLPRVLSPLRLFSRPRGHAGLGILMYHRFTDVIPGVAAPTFNCPPRQLRKQLSGLLRLGFKPWRLSEALRWHAAGRPFPARSFVVTIDDGFENTLTGALPVFRELNVPATLFVATAYLDSKNPFPNDDWTAAGSDAVPANAWRALTTEQCKALQDSQLVELGAHTHTHDDFRNRPDDLAADLRLCAAVLRDRFGVEQPMFAFPYGVKRLGLAGGVLSEVVRRAGMQCALSTETELVTPGSDPFDWGRFNVEPHDTANSLAVKLDGWFTWCQQAWRTARHDRQASRVSARSHDESASAPVATMPFA